MTRSRARRTDAGSRDRPAPPLGSRAASPRAAGPPSPGLARRLARAFRRHHPPAAKANRREDDAGEAGAQPARAPPPPIPADPAPRREPSRRPAAAHASVVGTTPHPPGEARFVDDAVPVVLGCVGVRETVVPSRRSPAAGEQKNEDALRGNVGTRTSNRVAREFHLVLASTDAPPLLAVVALERSGNHYAYRVARDVLDVATDAVGRPFSTPPRIRTARDARAWLVDVVAKSASVSAATRRSHAHAGATATHFPAAARSVTSIVPRNPPPSDEPEPEPRSPETEAATRWCRGGDDDASAEAEAASRTRRAALAGRLARGLPGGEGAPLADADARSILREIDASGVDLRALERTDGLVGSVAALATAGGAVAMPLAAAEARRMLLAWKERAERCVAALERRCEGSRSIGKRKRERGA